MAAKEDILLRSFQYIRKHGFHPSSMSELAKNAGLSKAGLYHHFSSKDSLLKELVIRSIAFTERETFSLAYRKEFSARKNLDDMLAKMKLYMLVEQGGCFIGNLILQTGSTNDELTALYKAFISKWIAAFSNIFCHFYKDEKANELGLLCFQLIEGTLMSIQVLKDNSQFDIVCTRIKKLIHEV